MDKKYAVVTGASSGIGAEFAKRLAGEGYALILIARRLERLEALKEEILSTCECDEISVVSCDLSDREEVQDLCEKLSTFPVEVFVNNAGFGDCGYFPEGNLFKECQMIDVNITAMHILAKQMVIQMNTQGYGYILNVASSAGLLPAGPYMATYYATKSYVTSFTRAVAEELRQHKSPVYMGCLCPGPVDTEFNDVADVKFALKGISPEYCANYAVDQMFRRKIVIVPSFKMKFAIWGGNLLPKKFLVRLTARQQKKKLS